MLKAIGCCANKGKAPPVRPPATTELGPTPAPSEDVPIAPEPLDGPVYDEIEDDEKSDYMEPIMPTDGIRNRVNPSPMHPVNMHPVIHEFKQKHKKNIHRDDHVPNKDDGYVDFNPDQNDGNDNGITGHHGNGDSDNDNKEDYVDMEGNVNKAFISDDDAKPAGDYVNIPDTPGVLPKTQRDNVTKPQKHENTESGPKVDVEGTKKWDILRKKLQNRNATNPMNPVLKEMEQKMDCYKPGHAVACSEGVANNTTKTKKEVNESSDDGDDNSQHSYENANSWTDGVHPPNIIVPAHEEQDKGPPPVKPKTTKGPPTHRASNPAQTNRKKYENTSIPENSRESRDFFERDRRSDQHHIAEVHLSHKPRIEPEDEDKPKSHQEILRGITSRRKVVRMKSDEIYGVVEGGADSEDENDEGIKPQEMDQNQNETESENTRQKSDQNKPPVESIGITKDVKPPEFVCANHKYVNDPRLKNTGEVMDETKGDKQSVKPPTFTCVNSKQEQPKQPYVNVPKSKPPDFTCDTIDHKKPARSNVNTNTQPVAPVNMSKKKGDVTLPVNVPDDKGESSEEYIPDSDSDSDSGVIYDDTVLPIVSAIKAEQEEEEDIYDDENILVVVSGIKTKNSRFGGNQRPTPILPSLPTRDKGPGDKQPSGQVANIPEGQQQNTQQIGEQDIYEDTEVVWEGIQGIQGMQTGTEFHHPLLHAVTESKTSVCQEGEEEDEIDQRRSVGPVLPGRMRPQPGSSIGNDRREVNNNEDITEDIYESVEVPPNGVQSEKNKTPNFNKDVENMVKNEPNVSKFFNFGKGKKGKKTTDKTADREEVKTNEPVTDMQGADGKFSCDKRPPMPLPKPSPGHSSVTQSTPDVRGADMSNFIRTHGINTAQRVKQATIKSELFSKLQERNMQRDS